MGLIRRGRVGDYIFFNGWCGNRQILTVIANQNRPSLMVIGMEIEMK